MTKNLTGLRMLGIAVVLMPFAIAPVQFAVGNNWTGVFCMVCGVLSVIAGTWDRELSRKALRLWRNTELVRRIAAAVFLGVIVLIVALCGAAQFIRGEFWQGLFSEAAAIFLATR